MEQHTPYSVWDSLDSPDDFNLDIKLSPGLDSLPRIMPHFFVPTLEDKPQNPIMENLKLESMNTTMAPRAFRPVRLPQELMTLAMDIAPLGGTQSYSQSVEEMWRNAVVRKRGVKSGLLSWDRLRQSHLDAASPTPFLSEQGESVYASARNHVQPRLFYDLESTIYLTQRELFRSLKLTLLGVSSPYHVWDRAAEHFVPAGSKKFLCIDGKDEVISNSLIDRFLKIGTLLRRLETFLSEVQNRSSKHGTTIHSLAHALSTIVDYLRETITKCPPSQDLLVSQDNSFPLLSVLAHYEPHESVLETLAELFGRDYDVLPANYPAHDLSPVSLLSRIYRHLNAQIERQSSVVVRATTAFLLTITSQEYFKEVAQSVGFGVRMADRALKPKSKPSGLYELDLEEDEEEEEDIFDLLDRIETSFPDFFPEKVLQALPAAQKSLVLLKIARPDHPILSRPVNNSHIRWLWTTAEIAAAWDGLPLPPDSLTPPSTEPRSNLSPTTASLSYKPELLGFRVFDLEPGDSTTVPSIQLKSSSASILERFISNFPPALPSITPILSNLTSLVFKDLMTHSESLSSALLDVFIDSPGMLDFRSHLVILRSFLLVTDPSFRSRLLDALFSDAGEYTVNSTAHYLSVQSVRHRQKQSKLSKEVNQPWAVGLSPNLLERESWPPVGSDLSFFLRTVIVDSLEIGDDEEGGASQRDPVVKEAGWRLGFAIRDLPTGPGRDKWLDPLSMEALDFLYLDYKPPHPMEVLISPDILSKYQRMFTFILRLLRVESALKSLFRMSSHRALADFLFPTLTRSRRLLLYFRFVSQAYVSSLSGYVFETAIGGNFDPFLARLSSSRPDSSAQGRGGEKRQFNDVFELAQSHSALLDNILTACLLRSGQRGVGDILRQSLELVLEFTIVIGELHRGRIQEFQAAPLMEELFSKFGLKMKTLTKVLRGLVDKNSATSTFPLSTHTEGDRRPTGGLEALYHLLIRIDIMDWWSKEPKPTH